MTPKEFQILCTRRDRDTLALRQEHPEIMDAILKARRFLPTRCMLHCAIDSLYDIGLSLVMHFDGISRERPTRIGQYLIINKDEKDNNALDEWMKHLIIITSEKVLKVCRDNRYNPSGWINEEEVNTAQEVENAKAE